MEKQKDLYLNHMILETEKSLILKEFSYRIIFGKKFLTEFKSQFLGS